MPRRPQRANGQKRYDTLLDAAEEIVLSMGIHALTVNQLVAQTATSKASVYHFFPHTSALCIALAEKYLARLSESLLKPVEKEDAEDWRSYFGVLVDRAVAFYNADPAATRVILGSDYSWYVRQTDLSNNEKLSATAISEMARLYGLVPDQQLAEMMRIAGSACESVWMKSVSENGFIDDYHAEQSKQVVIRYIEPALTG